MSAISSNQELRFRSTRIIAILAGALAIIVLYKTLIFLSLERRVATAIAAAIGFVPMFSHMASGTNHDVPLFLISALAAHYFARYIVGRALPDAYLCAFWLAIAGATKMTALVLIVPLVVILVFELEGKMNRILVHGVGITVLAFSLPSIWFARNAWYFGNPFATWVSEHAGKAVGNLSFFEFMRTYPAIEQFVLNFFGLFGWLGTGKGKVHWFQIYGFPLQAYTVIFLGFCLIIAIGSSWVLQKKPLPALAANGSLINYFWILYDRLKLNRIVYSRVLLTIILLASIAPLLMTQPPNSDRMRTIATMALMYAAAVSMVTIISGRQGERTRLFSYCVATAGFFAAVLIAEIFSVSNVFGRLAAPHGRYMYPVIPLLIIAFGLLAKHSRILRFASIVAVLMMAYLEAETFIVQVVPFYD